MTARHGHIHLGIYIAPWLIAGSVFNHTECSSNEIPDLPIATREREPFSIQAEGKKEPSIDPLPPDIVESDLDFITKDAVPESPVLPEPTTEIVREGSRIDSEQLRSLDTDYSNTPLISGEPVQDESASSVAPQSVAIPATYGAGTQILIPGFGLLAQPEFDFSLDVAFGYDDNPRKTRGNDGQASAFSELGINSGYRLNSKKRALAIELGAGLSYYLERPGDRVDYNGNLTFGFLERVSTRLQLSASVDLAYLSRADIARPNTPVRNSGDVVSGFSRVDLAYRVTRRITSVTGVSYNAVWSEGEGANSGTHNEFLIGTSLQYWLLPKIILTGDIRYGIVKFPDRSERDSNSLYLLIGAEHAGDTLHAALRAGLSLRDTNNDTDSGVNPHLEFNASWRFGSHATIDWSTSLISENGGSDQSTDPTLRSSFGFIYAFGPRLRADARFAVLRQEILNRDNQSIESEPEWAFDVRIGISYVLSQHWSFRASYQYLEVFSSSPEGDFRQNRAECGLTFSF